MRFDANGTHGHTAGVTEAHAITRNCWLLAMLDGVVDPDEVVMVALAALAVFVAFWLLLAL